jgi:L,D-peptidoglycan transpeptidase YkuD (ErfK/YbiS/YcfS/YnhG family)
LRFAKRYFYFTEDSTEAKSLSVFIANEKSAGHPTAAWASQTGKGLLFFAKRAEDKATPTGIFNLVSEYSQYTISSKQRETTK